MIIQQDPGGCEKKIQCDSPGSTEGYVVTEKNTVAQLLDVDASCARGFEGKAVVSKCAKTGQPYQLSLGFNGLV
jgi:hypothetical protein